MRATITVSALLSASVSLAAALAVLSPSPQSLDPRFEGKRTADTVSIIDLDPRADGLDKRTNIKYCIAGTAESGVCLALVGTLSAIAFGIASLAKSDANANDCSTHTGSVDGVHWEVYATGQNCDTTAQLNTIAGAISKYLKEQDSQVCGVHCIRLDHGGTWNGYVTLAPAGQSLDSFYCGSAYSFGQCGSGGEDDA